MKMLIRGKTTAYLLTIFLVTLFSTSFLLGCDGDTEEGDGGGGGTAAIDGSVSDGASGTSGTGKAGHTDGGGGVGGGGGAGGKKGRIGGASGAGGNTGDDGGIAGHGAVKKGYEAECKEPLSGSKCTINATCWNAPCHCHNSGSIAYCD